jgi:hypothetical protein
MATPISTQFATWRSEWCYRHWLKSLPPIPTPESVRFPGTGDRQKQTQRVGAFRMFRAEFDSGESWLYDVIDTGISTVTWSLRQSPHSHVPVTQPRSYLTRFNNKGAISLGKLVSETRIHRIFDQGNDRHWIQRLFLLSDIIHAAWDQSNLLSQRHALIA